MSKKIELPEDELRTLMQALNAGLQRGQAVNNK